MDAPHSQPLTIDQVRTIARLARLALTDAELEQQRSSLSAIVGYIDRLRAIDLTGVEPLTHVSDTHTRLGEDTPGPALPTYVLQRLAPESWEAFVKVPKVLDEGGGA